MTDNPIKPTPEVVQAAKEAVEEKKEHLDEVAAAIAKPSARKQAYQRIIDVTKRSMTEYYGRYPARALDDRSQDAETWSLNGLRAIFTILDAYEISFRNERSKDEPNSTTL